MYFFFIADGFNFGNLTDPLTIALRPITRGVDPIAAVWDFDLLDGHGGWCGKGCHLITSAGNITTLQCTHFGNFAVLMVSMLTETGGTKTGQIIPIIVQRTMR